MTPAKKHLLHTILIICILLIFLFILGEQSLHKVTQYIPEHTTQTAAVADFNSSLIAHYTFDEGSGAAAGDSAGSNSATLSGGTSFGTGRIGTAANLNGTSGAVVAPSDFIGTSAMSASLWIYPRGPGQITASIIDNGQTRLLYASNSRVSFCSDGSTCPSSATGALPLNAWTHIVVTRDSAGTTNIYANGSLSGTANQNSGTPVAGTGPVKLGNSPNGAHTFDGLLDDVRIYSRVLSPSEVGELYAYAGSGSGTPPPPPPVNETPPPPPPPPVESPTIPPETTPAIVSSECTSTNIRCVDDTAGPTQEYATIQACAATSVAGDTCLVFPGTYNERVAVSRSGSASQPITFRANGSGVVARGFTITANYITIEGFEITHISNPGTYNYPALYISGTTGVKILNNNIHHIDGAGVNSGNSSFLQIRGNQLNYMGYPVYPRSGRAAFEGIFGQPSSDVLIENNSVSYVSDYLNPYGTHFVYRNNTLGPTAAEIVEHVDGIQPNGITTRSLMENNLSLNNNSSDNHFFLNQRPESAGWIMRYNRTFGSKGGFDWRDADNHYLYNNTFYDNYVYYPSGFQILLTNSVGNIARNNIWYHSVSPGGNPYSVGSGSAVDKDYDLWFNSGSPGETHGVNADPLFSSTFGGSFSLQPSSPAVDRGGPLTTATNAGSGSVTLQVADAGLFQDGWAGVTPDGISVGSPANHASISSINYGANTITLRSPLSWSSGAPVYLFSDSSGRQVLYGSAPDIGASEYNSGTLSGQTPGVIIPVVPTVPLGSSADFNSDGLVNALDFSALVSFWNRSSATHDLNHDGVVNTLDYSTLAQQWTR